MQVCVTDFLFLFLLFVRYSGNYKEQNTNNKHKKHKKAKRPKTQHQTPDKFPYFCTKFNL